MGEQTAISWCDHTFNGWIGCTRVSEACRNCYAEVFGNRFGIAWGPNTERKVTSDANWKKPLKWAADARRELRRARVFCSSLSDVFEDRHDLDVHRTRLWDLIDKTASGLDWLVLTKRPENFPRMLPWVVAPVHGKMLGIGEEALARAARPWPNVWLGVTAEDNARAEERILALRGVPAAVRFVSCEPILEHIGADTWDLVLGARPGLGPIHWLIVGDESGANARPAKAEWVRTARDACARHNVAFHFKQWCGSLGSPALSKNEREDGKKKIHLPLLDGVRHAAFPAGGVP